MAKLGFEPRSHSFPSVMLPQQMIGATAGDMNSVECTQRQPSRVLPPIAFLGQVITECQSWRAFIQDVVPSFNFIGEECVHELEF